MARDDAGRGRRARWNVAPGDCRAENGSSSRRAASARYGELADAAAKLTPPARRHAQGPEGLEADRQADAPPRHAGEDHRQGRVRHGRAAPGLLHRRGRAPAGVRRQGQTFDATQGAKRARRRRGRADPERRRRASPSTSGPRSSAAMRSKSSGTRPGAAAVDTPALRERVPQARARRPARSRRRPARSTPRSKAPRTRSRPSTRCRTSRTRRWSRSTARSKIGGDGCEIWTGTQFQTVDQRIAAEILGIKPEKVTHPHDVPRRRLRPAREPDVGLRRRGGRRSRRRPASRSRWCGRARTTSAAATTGRCSVAPARRARRRRQAGRLGAHDRRPVDPRRHAVRGDDDQGRHRRHVGRRRRRLAVPRRRSRRIASTALAEEPGPGAVVALGRQHAHRVRRWRASSTSSRTRRSRIRSRTASRCCRRIRASVARSSSPPRKSGWGKPLPAGHARGLAVHESFGSIVAQVAEVSVEDGKHPRAPRRLRGRLRHGGQPARRSRRRCRAASRSASPPRCTASSRSKDGRVEQSNFHDYPVLRMHEMPKVEVHIVPSTAKMGGIGEPARRRSRRRSPTRCSR